MPLNSFLLRVLLCICLVFNGSSNALAAAHMQLDHVKTPAATAEQPAEPCDQHAATSAEVSTPATDMDQSSALPEKHAPDCCKAGSCHCACIQQVPAAVFVYLVRDAVIGHPISQRKMKTGHAAPALPHMIRPPIG